MTFDDFSKFHDFPWLFQKILFVQVFQTLWEPWLISSILFWYGMWSCIWLHIDQIHIILIWNVIMYLISMTNLYQFNYIYNFTKIFNEAGNCFLKQSKYTTMNASVNDRFVAPYVAHVAVLTHWGRDKMDTISQTPFLSAFSWMKIFEFWLKLHWSLFLRVQLTIFQHWFR